ncbi:transcription-repair coupling factor [Hyphobacterium sp. CCMP332]|uniref:transcription-repair coupling factor n=1 Tax=Hyphobacterium sp. CCMP332 TaxID=2749086 RepID=UPI00165086FD|nr:transcription-repair coupling factor [Hyphobacterium sp. CCMP332]QNL18741.1 transcription-repair coupling factor [Hyphobacterium sp. CCMP332]
MDWIEPIASSPGGLTVGGAPEGYDALVLAQALIKRGGTALFIARDDSRAAAFESAWQFFASKIPALRLPSWDCQPYDRVSPSPRVAARRSATLAWLATRSLNEKSPLLIIATINAVTQKCAPRATMAARGFQAKPGEVIDLEELKTYLTANGYARTTTVREPGDFAIRGGVVDAFPPGREEPVRLDMFGDTLESVRSFDPETQRSTRQLKVITFSPVSELFLDEASISRFRSGYVREFGAITDGDPVYEGVSAGHRPQGIEHWLPLFHETLETPFDYLGSDALIAVDHQASDALVQRDELVSDYYDARKTAAGTVKGGIKAPTYRALAPSALYLTSENFVAALNGMDVRRFTPFNEPDAFDAGGRQGRSFAAERAAEGVNIFDVTAKYIQSQLSFGKRVVIASWTEGASDRMGSVLADHGLKTPLPANSWADIQKASANTALRTVLPLEHGFEAADLVVLSEQDVLGDRLARPRRKKGAEVILEAGSLGVGDLVVHSDHGLGRYLGLKTLDVHEAPHDCLEIEYSGGSKLFLPVENIELLSRYGNESDGIQLDKLGGVAWQARKAKAKKRLRDMAEELIRVAAQRNARKADVITPPSGTYDEFSAAFPYVETDDQLSAIEDVFGDLASGRPMDRLICGDVGFGKTEVALRAAFITAMEGRQVAVVAPTTLLARQHFKTFSERFRNWPVKVRHLSRLVPAKEAALTKKELQDGKAEIVVGTHALLSDSVKFSDLGLLIVDEEQHFGVKHKERLKALRTNVHVLTLTATPIPRTLQLALTGIRDLSIIATPPIDRLAVRTYVSPFDPVTVREALLREKYRGGLSYFVAPRITDLDSMAVYLREQVPEVSFMVAHGQMAPTRLEDIMTAFYEGRYDVLVSTSIVESGLDIPTANTLIIYRADRFGLAQLYQLRGRVGRSKTRAYAHLTTSPNQQITAQAERRLQVLHSLDTLGAGFSLASHDLDIRGGGNLLGEEQSGHIRDVGVELYQSMLEEAVSSLQNDREEDDRDWSPAINAGAAVLIPESYVADLDLRLQLYRRVSNLANKGEREAFAAELIDRFGPLPEEVEQLMHVMQVKTLCKIAGVQKIDAGPKGATIQFRNGEFADPVGLVKLITDNPREFRVRPDQKLLIAGDWPEPRQRLRGMERALARLADLARRS